MFPHSGPCAQTQTHATQQSPESHEFAESILHKDEPEGHPF